MTLLNALPLPDDGPGRYLDVPNEVYHRWDACNNSQLSHMKRSAAYAFYRRHHYKEPTDAQALGTAIHCALLEPARFERHYRLDPPNHKGEWPKGWRNSNDYKAQKSDLLAHGFDILRQEHFDACRVLQEGVRENPRAAEIFDSACATEVSVVVESPDHPGVMLKVRPDLLCPDAGQIWDVKKTKNIDPDLFARDMFTFQYHQGSAFYLDAMNALEPGTYNQFGLLVVADDPPFEVRPYIVGERSIDLGRITYQARLKRWSECEADGHWPAGGERIQEIDVHHWAFDKEI